MSKKLVLLVLDHRTWNSIIGYSIFIGYSSSWTKITYTNSNSISWNWLIYFHRTKNIAQFPFLHFLPFLLTVLRKCKRASFRQNIHVIFWNFCNKVCSVKQDTKHSIVLLPRLVSFFTERTLKSGWNDIRPVSIWKNRISVLVVIGPKLLGQDENSKFWVTQFCSVCIFFEESVFTFQFLNDKIYTYAFFFDIHTWNFLAKVLYMSKNTLPSKNIWTEQN